MFSSLTGSLASVRRAVAAAMPLAGFASLRWRGSSVVGRQLELLLREGYDLWVWRDRWFPEVSQHHLAVAVSDTLPRTENHVVEGLLEIELADPV